MKTLKGSIVLTAYILVLFIVSPIVFYAFAGQKNHITNIEVPIDRVFQDYEDFFIFQSAFGDPLTTITFTEVPLGTVLTTQYLYIGVQFTDGNDTTLSSASFEEDGVGVNGNGRVHIHLLEPAEAIGTYFPGALTIDIYDVPGGNLLYTSSDFAGSGTGFFGGVVTDQSFTYVVLRDWVDDLVFLDDIFIGFGKGPSWGGVYRNLFDSSSDLELLRQYRDTVLSKTANGKKYKDMLYKSSEEALNVMLENPGLMAQAKALIYANILAIDDVLHGHEGIIYNTDEITSFLDAYAKKAPPKLKLLAKMVKRQMLRKQKAGKLFFGFRLE